MKLIKIIIDGELRHQFETGEEFNSIQIKIGSKTISYEE